MAQRVRQDAVHKANMNELDPTSVSLNNPSLICPCCSLRDCSHRALKWRMCFRDPMEHSARSLIWCHQNWMALEGGTLVPHKTWSKMVEISRFGLWVSSFYLYLLLVIPSSFSLVLCNIYMLIISKFKYSAWISPLKYCLGNNITTPYLHLYAWEKSHN